MTCDSHRVNSQSWHPNYLWDIFIILNVSHCTFWYELLINNSYDIQIVKTLDVLFLYVCQNFIRHKFIWCISFFIVTRDSFNFTHNTPAGISYALSYFNQFRTCYDSTHWTAAKRVFFGGGLISWVSRKQRTVAFHQTKPSNYIVLTESAKESIYLQNFFCWTRFWYARKRF